MNESKRIIYSPADAVVQKTDLFAFSVGFIYGTASILPKYVTVKHDRNIKYIKK